MIIQESKHSIQYNVTLINEGQWNEKKKTKQNKMHICNFFFDSVIKELMHWT